MDGLIVCSHRGPFTYHSVDGRLETRPGSGGVVTALAAVLKRGTEVSWLACALTDRDREAARSLPAVQVGDVRARLLDIAPDLHRRFYDDACITGLGFLFHGLVDLAYAPTFDARFSRGWTAYRAINAQFAAEAVLLAGRRPVLVEDYHLMLVADEARKLGWRPRSPLAYFHHIPWCQPAYFGLLPAEIRREILAGILAFDTIGFHARRWAREFLACCEMFLPEARCDEDRVRWDGREVPIVVAPVQVDAPHLRGVMASDAADRWRLRLRRLLRGRRAVVRVDRVDLWKNILRGFQAFERLVQDEGARDVAFVALLSRSRMHVPEYRRYMSACIREARRVNRRLNPGGRGGPIHVLLTDDHSDHSRALAGLSLADVVLVNSTSDGLNLVAKEAVVATEGRARLVLSENTGVHEHIGPWTHGINPFDVQETAAAVARGLRERGMENGSTTCLMAAVESDSPDAWVRRRLDPVQ